MLRSTLTRWFIPTKGLNFLQETKRSFTHDIRRSPAAAQEALPLPHSSSSNRSRLPFPSDVSVTDPFATKRGLYPPHCLTQSISAQASSSFIPSFPEPKDNKIAPLKRRPSLVSMKNLSENLKNVILELYHSSELVMLKGRSHPLAPEQTTMKKRDQKTAPPTTAGLTHNRYDGRPIDPETCVKLTQFCFAAGYAPPQGEVPSSSNLKYRQQHTWLTPKDVKDLLKNGIAKSLHREALSFRSDDKL